MLFRKVIKVISGTFQEDGGGVPLMNLVGYANVNEFDPFLLFNVFYSVNPYEYTKGFPAHPHRGIEVLNYMLKGCVRHTDSIGNDNLFEEGGIQWLTTGRGLVHEEMPQKADGFHAFHLWVNLPGKSKMVEPDYLCVKSDLIPVVKEECATVKILSGSYKGISGVKGKYVDVLSLDIQITPDKEFVLETEIEANIFVYIIEGDAQFSEDADSEYITFEKLLLFDKEEKLYVKSGKSGVRLLLVGGKPLNEPIAWGGPIVMNTHKELENSFLEIDKGTFLKRR